MQTILGANGQIAIELARELRRRYTQDIRLVSRNPEKVNDTDMLFPANLMYAEKADEAIKGSGIVYFTVGLPVDTETWINQFPVIVQNVIDACKKHKAKLVYFDNTYMYPQNDNTLTEQTAFAPVGMKGKVRASIATMILEEIKSKNIEALICRAPEFYGPGKTQSITNSLIFVNIRKSKSLKVLLNADTLRTLIWSPDASKATALLGNTPDAFGQTWHLPCDDNRLTYRHFIALISEVYGQQFQYNVLNELTLKIGSIFNKQLKEIRELLPRYEHNNIFDSSKFKQRFPDFTVTTYKQGIEQIFNEQITMNN
jgi:nucleoside-diphosphate-sugar epimerase